MDFLTLKQNRQIEEYAISQGLNLIENASDEICEKIKNSSISIISLSIDGTTAVTYDDFRSQKGAYEGKCGACEFIKICGGCRARAYNIHGSYLAEEPFYNHMPVRMKQKRKLNFIVYCLCKSTTSDISTICLISVFGVGFFLYLVLEMVYLQN